MRLFSFFLFAAATAAHAQFEMQESNTTASLRGIHSVGAGVAWASGTNGTVLRTEDGGYVWQGCAVPPGAEKLDFRGIQGFDANTAIVMSSGPGDLSRIYKTTDGCSTWKLVFTNPDKDGFFDAIRFTDGRTGYLLGDPVDGRYVVLGTMDGGVHWTQSQSPGLASVKPGMGAFAASNSSLLVPNIEFGTGGPDGPYVYVGEANCTMGINERDPSACLREMTTFSHVKVPMEGLAASAGIFAMAISSSGVVAVGGDYTKPTQATGTAAYFDHYFGGWFAAKQMPRGYRSAVAYDAASDTWIAVGPSGADLSKDDGKSWQPLHPEQMDQADSDKNWNALSLPFVVGPKGRIGKLRPEALVASPKK